MEFMRSVRARLTGWYSAVLGLVLVVFSLLLYGAVRYQSLHHHDDALRTSARQVLSILEQQHDCAVLTPDQMAELRRLNHLVMVHELAGQGEVFYRSPDLDPVLMPRDETEIRRLLALPESFETVETSAGALRVYSRRYTTDTGRQGAVRVMDRLGNVMEALNILYWALLLMVPLCLLVAGGGGYWLAGRALRPVAEVTALAREIEATNLGRRLPVPKSDDELGRLVATFNQMIDRLEGAFDGMGRFTADASHELKTPLTTMRGTIEVTLGRERSVDEHRRTLTNLLEEVERMARIVDDLLILARADAGALELQRKPVRLDEITADVVEALQPLSAADRTTLAIDGSARLVVSGDERWLRQLVVNLIGNALKHGGARGTVRVRLEEHDGQAVLSVRDTGAGIPLEEQRHLFERFYRVDRARGRGTGGTGLGLSIALWIARSHGGDILVDSRVGLGSTFRAVLPLMTAGARS